MCVPHQNFTFVSKIFNFNKKKMKCSLPPVKAYNPYHHLKDPVRHVHCHLTFLTLTTCSIKNFLPRH